VVSRLEITKFLKGCNERPGCNYKRNFPISQSSLRPIAASAETNFVGSKNETMNTHVALDEKLAVLQENDSFRKWYSLDDCRVCILCDRLITGRMIDIWKDKRGSYHLHCPTPGCDATPRDWFYHGPTAGAQARFRRDRAPAPDLVATAA